jgi:hypothetical protein
MDAGGTFFGGKVAGVLYLVARFKNGGTVLPFPQYVFMVWCLINVAQE